MLTFKGMEISRNDTDWAVGLMRSVLRKGGLSERIVTADGRCLDDMADPHLGMAPAWMFASEMVYAMLAGRRMWCASYYRDSQAQSRLRTTVADPDELDLDPTLDDAVRGLCLRMVIDDCLVAGEDGSLTLHHGAELAYVHSVEDGDQVAVPEAFELHAHRFQNWLSSAGRSGLAPSTVIRMDGAAA